MKRVYQNLINKTSGLAAALLLGASPVAASAQDDGLEIASTAQRATYVDLVTMAEQSQLVIRAQIRRQTRVSAERAPGLEPGSARLYIEADTIALIAGKTSVGGSLAYLVDVPLDAKGKPPKLKKREVILFADPAGVNTNTRATQLQLTSKNAQLDYSPAFEARLRPILTSLAAPNLPPRIEGISDALAVQGTLAGESETQIFLGTQDRSPVSITVLRRPGQRAVWGVSWGEIIDSAAQAPQRETLRWYRLACSLPRDLPSRANLARDPQARRLAAQDYALVVSQLGTCERAITE